MENPTKYLTAAKVRGRYGEISDMTLWRWLGDPDLAFPRPMVVNRRRLWNEADLDQFDARQRKATAA